VGAREDAALTVGVESAEEAQPPGALLGGERGEVPIEELALHAVEVRAEPRHLRAATRRAARWCRLRPEEEGGGECDGGPGRRGNGQSVHGSTRRWHRPTIPYRTVSVADALFPSLVAVICTVPDRRAAKRASWPSTPRKAATVSSLDDQPTALLCSSMPVTSIGAA
jgi:hypothetical protein